MFQLLKKRIGSVMISCPQ